MGKLPGINHLDAVCALQKAGFRIARQGKHIVMTDGVRILTVPRHNPVNAFTMAGHYCPAKETDRNANSC
jgi:predicted RNA binding protein YcfA (HicA-like mRNA interferase family)